MENILVRGSAGITTDDQTNAALRRQQGEFVRGVSTARNFVGVADAESGNILYPVESGRYHLYVAFNCPWCHRVLLGRAIMGLEDVFTVDVCFPNRSTEDETLGANLWKFEPNGVVGMNGQHVKFRSCTGDTVMNKKYVKEIYAAAGITNQTSVPILDLLRMMGTVFRPLAKHVDTIDLYPNDKASEINEINDWIYTDVANGAYKAGFSSNQEAYEAAFQKFFLALERLDKMLGDSTFLVGDNVTEADVRLFPTLFRFDPVYYNRFKLNQKMLWEYKHLWRWMGTMMRFPGMEPVSNEEYLQHCKQGYFGRTGNGTIPLGPLGYPTSYLEKHWTHQ